MTKEVDEFVSGWYQMLRNGLPGITDPKFTTIAANSNGFDKILGIQDRNFSTQIEKSETAYADRPHNRIVLPLWYFSEDVINKFEMGKSQNVSMALINGSSLHEKLHLIYSPDDLEVFTSLYSGTQVAIEKYGKSIIFNAFNVLEDLYIEALASPQINGFIQLKNQIFFKECPSEIKSTKLSDVMAVLVYSKNKCFQPQISNMIIALRPSASRLISQVLAGFSLSSEKRAELFTDFINFFDPDSSETQNEEEKKSEEKGKDEAKKFGPTDPEQRAGEEASEGMEMLNEDEEQIINMVASEFKSKAEAYERRKKQEVKSSGIISSLEVTKHDILSHSTDLDHFYGSPAQVNLSFSFLPTLLRLQTKNNVPGETRKAGSHLVNTKLSRIITDGKMFANRSSEADKVKQAEVIILGDASGSMMMRVGEIDSRVTLFSVAIETSRKIHKALRKGMVANSVYFHTSEDNDNSAPILVHISSFNMKTTNSNIDERFDALMGLPTKENYDGFAIKEVAKEFTKRQNRKIIIVLSDGEPSGPGYHGSEATKHTKEEIAKLRKSGISVICISLVKEVVSSNTEIYGREFNIDGSSNLSKEFERVILKIQNELR